MSTSKQFSAFVGRRLLKTGTAAEVANAVKRLQGPPWGETVLIFCNRTGRQVDFDLQGPEQETDARALNSDEPRRDEPKKSAGRPRIGVVSRKISLLPRHWNWLSFQRGGVSATLRRLVDESRKLDEHKGAEFDSRQAADRFMATVVGNEPGYEDALRALYTGDRTRFLALSDPWPVDFREHARWLAEPSFNLQLDASNQTTSRDVLVAQFGISWALMCYHLENLSTEECLWRPANPCLQVRNDTQGTWRPDWPETEEYTIGPPSIAWTTWHICFWWEKALAHMRNDVFLPDKDDITWPGSADGVRRAITELQESWSATVSGMSDEDFYKANPTSWPMPDSSPSNIAAWINVELMKNAAEIGLIRFLYAARGQVDGTDGQE